MRQAQARGGLTTAGSRLRLTVRLTESEQLLRWRWITGLGLTLSNRRRQSVTSPCWVLYYDRGPAFWEEYFHPPPSQTDLALFNVKRYKYSDEIIPKIKAELIFWILDFATFRRRRQSRLPSP